MKNGNTSIDAAVVAIQKGKEKGYWLNQFSGAPEKVSFPSDAPAGVSSGFSAAKLEFHWTGELFEKLLTVMKGSDYKLYMILAAGLVLLLNKYTGKDDIILGTPVLKQDLEVKFINTILALRNRINPAMTFKEFLLQVRQTIIQGTEHQNYPVRSLLNRLNLGDANEEEGFPLFDTVILLTDIHDRDYLNDLRVNTVFSFSRLDSRVEGELEYNASRYALTAMENLVGHFAALLSEVLEYPGKELGAVEIIGEVEKKRLLVEFNDTGVEFPSEQTIGAIFIQQAKKIPSHLAAVYEENQLTYGALQQKADRLAGYLREKGAGRGDILGLMVDRSLEMLIGILGILAAGGAYLPLDSEYPGERNLFLLKDSGARLILWQKSVMEHHRGILDYLSAEHAILLDDPPVDPGRGTPLPIPGHPGDPAYVIYTSGSSGTPKGVLVEQQNVLNLVFGLEQRIYRRYDRALHVCMISPYVFDASVKQVFAVLLLGHALYVVSQQTRADALRLIEYYYKHQVEISDGTPTHISLLWENLQGSGFTREGIGRFPVQRFIIGGEALSTQVVERFLSLFAANPPIITNVYGPTECCVDAACFEVSPQNLHLYRRIPIGKPMPNFQIFILDKEGLLQPIGVSGELCIGGSGVSRGYLNRPELSAEKFCLRQPGEALFKKTAPPGPPRKNFNNKLLQGVQGGGFLEKNPPGRRRQKIYQTGDLGRWLADGHLEYLGRIDRQVKIRGFRVELGEIENELLKHDAIKAAVVTVREDRDNDRTLCAYIVSAALLPQNELRDFLTERVPYYLIPQYFIPLEKIPLTWNGKIDRKALPEPGIGTGQKITSPRDPREEKLVRAWSEVLKIEEEKIGIDDDFFALGGHSLKAALMVARVHKVFDVKIPLGVVFDNPTVRGLADYIRRSAGSGLMSLEPAPIMDYYPLSSAQKRLFILQQLQPESTEYNLPVVVMKIEGNLDNGRLERAFQQLVDRHESFRTCFPVVEGEPRQQIVEALAFKIEYYDVPESQARPLINGYIRPFDLTRAPLLRAGVIRMSAQRCILMVDMHHIISDATSTQIFIKDLLALYAGKKLPPIPITYKDFSHWHNRLVQSGEIDKQEAYWLKEFSAELPVLNLPLDHERPPIRDFAGDTLAFELDRAVTHGLNEMAKTYNATLYMVLLSVFYVFLHKLGAQGDIIVGTDNAGRRHADLEPVIGMFVNSFAMRNYPAPYKTFRDFLEEVKERTIAAFDHQDYQFENLVEKVVSRRDSSRNPLFDVMFSYHNIAKIQAGELAEQKPGGLTFSPYGFEHKVSKFDLMLHGEEISEILYFHFEYSTRLFEKNTIERFTLYFKEIVRQLLENSLAGVNKTLAGIDPIPPREKRQLLEDFSGPVVALPDKTVVPLLEEHVAKVPDQIALVGPAIDGQSPGTAGEMQLSYREMNGQSGHLASSLAARGVREETMVGIMTERSLSMIIGILAVWKAGGAYLPIDPAYPQKRIDYMVRESNTGIILTAPAIEASIARFYRSYRSYRSYKTYISYKSYIPAGSSLAYAIYTSGTTGQPKGAIIEHRGMLNHLQAKIHDLQLTGSSIVAQNASHTFDISVWQFFAALLVGGKTMVYPNEIVLEPGRLINRVSRDKVTVLEVVPSYLSMMLDHLETVTPVVYMLSLAYLVVTGETVKVQLVERWFKIYPGVGVVNAYGPTEASDDIAHHLMTAPVSASLVPLGKPLQNFSVYIVDTVPNLCPIGVAGEIWVSGVGVGRGYLNQPGLTAEKFDQGYHDQKNRGFLGGPGGRFFKKAPLAAGGKLYKTGDLGRWLPDGVIEFLGRKDQQVKVRGFRIELGEIENRLLEHPGIKEVVVIDRIDENKEKDLCAYFTRKKETGKDETIGAVELHEYLSHVLPHYMVPSYFVELEKIPLTANGKIDTGRLPAPGLHERGLPGPQRSFTPPQTRLEKICAQVWSDVLGVDRNLVGIDDHFFQSGGHSLKAVTFLSRLHRELEVKIPLVTLFNAPTIRQLVGSIEGAGKSRYLSIEPLERKEYYPVSPAQRRMYIAREMEPESTVYNVFQIYELGKADAARWERALKQLVRRHESLRTSFHVVEDELVQRVRAEVSLEIEFNGPGRVEQWVRPFDLAAAPLLRVGLRETRDHGCLLLVDMHHIICDGISHDILVTDFTAFYEGNVPAPLKLQYKDYAQWQERCMKEELARQQVYWVKEFSNRAPVLNLAADYPRPAVRDFAGSVYSFALGNEQSAALRRLASGADATLFVLLLAIYYILLFKLTLQEDIVVGTPTAGRNHPGLEKIIGMFVNMLALRNYPRGDKIFSAWLREVKARTLEAFENRDFQFDELVELLAGDKDPARNPLFDVSFGFETLEREPAEPPEGPREPANTGKNETTAAGVQPVRRPHNTTRFDLSLYGVDVGTHLVFSFEYSVTLFNAKRIENFSRYFQEIIAAVLKNPGLRLEQIEISHELTRASTDFLQDGAAMTEF
jgi:amino acid adenylation domain-containing protein